eukprot:3914288-Rhodomonas_salina.1
MTLFCGGMLFAVGGGDVRVCGCTEVIASCCAEQDAQTEVRRAHSLWRRVLLGRWCGIVVIVCGV